MNRAAASAPMPPRLVGSRVLTPPIILGLAFALAAGLIAPIAMAKSLPIVAGLLLISLLALRLDDLLAVALIAFIVMVEFYGILGDSLLPMSPLIALIFVGVMLWGHTRWLRRVAPLALAWTPLVLLGALRILGSPALRESLYYWLDVMAAPLLIFLVGMLIARDIGHVRRLLAILTGFAVLLALHTIIEARTGIFLFETQRQANYLTSQSGFALSGTAASRAGSFLSNPDWNGAFLALMLFPPVGLIYTSRSWTARALALAAVAIIATAMLLTYTASAWVVSGVGLIVFLCVGLRGRIRWYSVAAIAFGGVVLVGAFHRQFLLLYHHATGQNELSLRLGAWETALRLIQHNLIRGIGYGQSNYLARAEPYRVAAQVVPLAHPHNAYLELAALGGIPLLLAFLLALFVAVRAAVRTLRLAPPDARPLIAAILASVTGFMLNNTAINGWTLQPLAAIGWLLLGAAASPLLARAFSHSGDPSGWASASSSSSGSWARSMPQPLPRGRA